ncbi:hypothetical protein BT96DRAFT_956582 [Gymnopus androsaceus JB14]|uniref:Uncharacterized protein n=1 Tax=Gymnopus androsaceus JB14 TaxID=1447944 RepID=A0A6A4HWK0_9AGAR|nr:hypothetical protein BT96DRAFT_956582 [Gymnopus androsaceus JB14]
MFFHVFRSLLGLFLSIAVLEAAQIPFVAPSTSAGAFVNESDSWDIKVPLNENATGHLVFETVNSFMQHWPNTRYRNGHNVVPGIVPPGTVLYHGRGDSNTPTEHSYLFCRGQTCWQLIVTTTRPLSVLYFDGSSAAKMPNGTMDSQDALAYGEIIPENQGRERARIVTLCEWAKGFNVDGFVSEIMLCDFTEGVQVEAFDVRARGNPHPGDPGRKRPEGGPGEPGRHLEEEEESYPPEIHAYASYAPQLDINSSALPNSGFEVVHSGSWHRFYPGETRIQLDLTRLVSFYDTELVPSLVPERFGKDRLKHRVLGISQEDIQSVVRRIEAATKASEPGSGIDWQTLIRLVVKRFDNRLEMVQYILNSTSPGNSALENEELAKDVQIQLVAMLRPYMLSSIKPSQDLASTEWVSPMYKLCSTTYTKYITTTPSLLSRLTASEHLILGGVSETTREICRVVTGMWVDGVMAGLDPDLYKPSSAEMEIESLLRSWKERISDLMKWLDWSVWLKCRPACGFEEICELPMWPFRGLGRPDDYDESEDPQPKCIRRMAPFESGT